MNTATIIETTAPNSHCPECHKNGTAQILFSGLRAYRLALASGAITRDTDAREIEVEIGSYEWALAEQNDYSLRNTSAPHTIRRIIDAHEKATKTA